MELLRLIENSQNIFSESPVRCLVRNNRLSPIQIVNEELNRIERDIEILRNKVEMPLKVVLMGEVKAGKSMLLNALAGGEASPVNVTEATASIIEISHSEDENGTIEIEGSDNITGSVSEIFEVLSNHHGDWNFFSKCKCVKLGLPLPSLKKLHLVDTPGLATITEQNSKVTQNYAQEADVVLWVINGNHLGQSDVEEALAQVAKLGKPILGIINRVDEIETDPKRLVMYTKQQLGIYLKEVFPLSAYKAYHSIINNEMEGIRESGLSTIMEYLEKNIERQSVTVHKESIISSVNSLMRQDLALHKSYQRNMGFIQEQIKKHSLELEYQNVRIQDKIDSSLKEWLEKEFLREEKSRLLSLVDQLGLFSSKADKQRIEQKMQAFFSAEGIQHSLEGILAKIDYEYKSQWEEALEKIQIRISKDIKNFVKKEHEEFNQSLGIQVLSGQELALEGAGKGAAIAGACGATMAGYAAWLGPYAASVSLGTALGAIVPPVLIVGAITGAVAKLLNFKKEQNKYKEAIPRQIRDIKDTISIQIIPKIIKAFKDQSDNIIFELQNKFIESICPSWNKEDLDKLQEDIEKYCETEETRIELAVSS